MVPPDRAGRGGEGHGGRSRGGGEDDVHAARAGGDAADADTTRGGGRDGEPGDASSHRHGAPLQLRKDAIYWFDGNPNTDEGSSSGNHRVHLPANDVVINGLNNLTIRPRSKPQFMLFREQEAFENNLEPQSPEINGLNDDLVLLFESIAIVRKNMYEMMCNLSDVNDPSSRGKEIGEQAKIANGLIKTAEEKFSQIKALGGEALPIPDQFYLDVKPLKS